MADSEQLGDERLSPAGSEAIKTKFVWSEVPPSTAIVEAVADVADCDAMELEPLYDVLDPDALDALIDDSRSHSTDAETSVSFRFDGHWVTVRRDGTVTVRPAETK